MNDPLRVAVLGAGTVGREVIRGFLDWPERLASHEGPGLELAGISVRDVDAARGRGLPSSLLTDAPAHLVADPGIDIVVEMMGGDEPARTLISAALAAGKAVVTANKHVIAHHGPELELLARQAGAVLRYEAAVGSGIPVLGPIAVELAANRILEVRGILNGTTNYILSAMTEDGRDYEAALATAQAAGYAETDPAGDVEGHDAVNKIVILARLCFGAWLEPRDVVTITADGPGHGRPGITGVTSGEISSAMADGEVIKLIALAVGRPDGIAASVLPTRVPADSPMGMNAGVLNRIEVHAEPLGTVAFVGPGAGGAATSSAVLGDLLAIARGAGSTWAGLPPATAPARPAGLPR